MPSLEQYKHGYLDLWHKMTVTKPREAAQQVAAIDRAKDRLMAVQNDTGVPWYVIGVISVRESGLVAGNLDFRAVLHNGERIVGTNRRTQLVPRGLGPFKTWEAAARDALFQERLNKLDWHGEDGIAAVAWALEKFNGFGYRSHGIPSPYLWGGTSVQRPGKYIRDGVFSPHIVDPQIGGMALLKLLMDEHHEDHPAATIAANPAHEPVEGGKAQAVVTTMPPAPRASELRTVDVSPLWARIKSYFGWFNG